MNTSAAPRKPTETDVQTLKEIRGLWPDYKGLCETCKHFELFTGAFRPVKDKCNACDINKSNFEEME